MFSLACVSSVVRAFSEDDLANSLAVSRRNDARLGVTGMLRYEDGEFMRILEGSERSLGAL